MATAEMYPLVPEQPAPPLVRAVFPAKDEAARGLAQTLEGFHAAFTREYGGDYVLTVVSNGSTDNTNQIAIDGGAELISLPRPGKGGALYQGLRRPGLYKVMIDADGAFKPDSAVRVLDAVQQGADIAVGLRSPNGEHPRTLRALARVGMLWTCDQLAPTDVPATEVQCGLKAFGPVIDSLLQEGFTPRGFAFDRAVLHRAKLHNYRVQGVGVDVFDNGNTTVRPYIDGPRMIFDAWRIRHAGTTA